MDSRERSEEICRIIWTRTLDKGLNVAQKDIDLVTQALEEARREEREKLMLELIRQIDNTNGNLTLVKEWTYFQLRGNHKRDEDG